MKKFMVAVKVGTAYTYMYITIDDFLNKDSKFYLELMQTSFPDRAAINRMLSKSRESNAKSIYTCDSINHLVTKLNEKDEVGCLVVFEDKWVLYGK